MSVCTFIASDFPLTEVVPVQDYPLEINIDDLITKHIKEIDDAEIWNTPDKMYPNKPSFYCLEIKR